MKSKSFSDKLNNKLDDRHATITLYESNLNDHIQNSLNRMFNSSDDLMLNLQEGMNISINKMASNYFAMPIGEYIVYNINGDSATLFPVESLSSLEPFNGKSSYTTTLTKLAKQWHNINSPLLSEDDEQPTEKLSNKEKVQPQQSKYPRDYKVKGAIEATGRSQEKIADKCGVDPSTVSRWTAKSGKGSRNPNLSNALCIAKQTGQDVETLFNTKPKTKKKKATSGSGGGRNDDFQKGNSSK